MTESDNPKVVYLTAGAGGMFCGSCMHDNALARALTGAGWDLQLIPTYTPIRTDERDVSVDEVFFGGINVFLQQKIPLFRWLPASLDHFLDNPKLIRRVTAKAMDTDPKTLGKLTLSMLRGVHGNQRKEVRKLCRYLAVKKPHLLVFSNILIGGCIEEIKKHVDARVLVTLQGDDVFLESLPETFKRKALSEIEKIGEHVDGFVVHSEFYRDHIGDYLKLDKQTFHVTPLGLELHDFESLRELPRRKNQQQLSLGYLARLAPEKGLHHLVDAFIEGKRAGTFGAIRLRIAGWLGPQNEAYANSQFDKLRAAGLESEFEYLGAIERDEKINFLKSLDMFSVPADFLEPKALYALEALAAGVPVIAPDHGVFPEMAASTGGIRLFANRIASSLRAAIETLAENPALRLQLAQQGQGNVFRDRNAKAMAKSTGDVFLKTLDRPTSA